MHRVTTAFLKVLAYFMGFDERDRGICGIDIIKNTNLVSGTVYPILNRMEETGWLESTEEDIDPKKEGRPKRRFYKLTVNGVTHGYKLLAEFIPDAKGYLDWKNSQKRI